MGRRLADRHVKTSALRFVASLLLALVRHIYRLPDVRLDFAVQAVFANNLRLSILDGLPAHRLRDDSTDVTRVRDRWKKARLFVFLCGQVTYQLRSRGLDHGVGDVPGFGGDDAKSEAGKDVRVVGLGDVNLLPAGICRFKGAAGADEGAAFGPVHQVLRCGFAA